MEPKVKKIIILDYESGSVVIRNIEESQLEDASAGDFTDEFGDNYTLSRLEYMIVDNLDIDIKT